MEKESRNEQKKPLKILCLFYQALSYLPLAEAEMAVETPPKTMNFGFVPITGDMATRG